MFAAIALSWFYDVSTLAQATRYGALVSFVPAVGNARIVIGLTLEKMRRKRFCVVSDFLIFLPKRVEYEHDKNGKCRFVPVAGSKAYHHRFRFYDAKNKVELSNVQEINTLELTKLPKRSDETDLFDWMMLIRAKSEEDYTMLAEKKPIFKKVVAVVKKLSADEEARMEYDKHELWRMDYAATMRNATRKGMARGIEKGMEKGRAEGKIETARTMKSKGFSIADIADITGLPKKEIEKL